jgi:hypothetical protein
MTFFDFGFLIAPFVAFVFELGCKSPNITPSVVFRFVSLLLLCACSLDICNIMQARIQVHETCCVPVLPASESVIPVRERACDCVD